MASSIMTEKMEALFAEIKETLNGIKTDTEQTNRRTEILKRTCGSVGDVLEE